MWSWRWIKRRWQSCDTAHREGRSRAAIDIDRDFAFTHAVLVLPVCEHRWHETFKQDCQRLVAVSQAEDQFRNRAAGTFPPHPHQCQKKPNYFANFDKLPNKAANTRGFLDNIYLYM